MLHVRLNIGLWFSLSLLFSLLVRSNMVAAETPQSRANFEKHHLLSRAEQPFTGDMPRIKERRFIRALVNYSKTNFFIHNGRLHGFEYELLKAYEKFLNRGVNRYYRIKLIYIPVPFDDLFEALNSGRGDIAAAGLTITPDRLKKAAFSSPYIENVREIVVQHASAAKIRHPKGLSGQTVYVRRGSSYVTHLRELNKKLAARKIPKIRIQPAAQYLVTEDILELVNSGAVEITVADHHIVDAWSGVLPKIAGRKKLAIHTGGKIAWAVRKDNTKLLDSINRFMRKNKKGKLLGNIIFKRYYRDSEWIENPNVLEIMKQMPELMKLFRKYGRQYGFNPLLLLALAYHESGLDQSLRSPKGAVGIMQVLPQTAAGERVDVNGIHELENNIRAGVRYLHYLRTEYFDDKGISRENRDFFALAAYNAGLSRIMKIRKLASKKGFDPNKWFFNVEKTAAVHLGDEVVEYVADTYKYFVVYQLQSNMDERRENAIKSAGGK